MKCVFSTLVFVLSLTFDNSSPDLNDELLVARIQSDGACFSRSAKVDSFSVRISGTASNTSQQSLTASARSSNASLVPGDLGGVAIRAVNDDRFSLMYLTASSLDLADGSRIRTCQPAATKHAAIRRPRTPPPSTQIGLFS